MDHVGVVSTFGKPFQGPANSQFIGDSNGFHVEQPGNSRDDFIAVQPINGVQYPSQFEQHCPANEAFFLEQHFCCLQLLGVIPDDQSNRDICVQRNHCLRSVQLR